MAFSQGRQNVVTWESLLEKVSEGEILAHYLNVSEVPCTIHSPIRVDDHKSFSLTCYNGNVLYKDFKTGESGTLLTLLTKYWGFKDVYTTIDKINSELVMHKTGKTAIIHKSTVKSEKTKTISDVVIQCKIREWKEHDLLYWKQYNITLEWLNFGNIFPISHVIITKNGITKTIPAEKYAYAYVEFKDNKESLKIYQPYSQKYKWSNNHDSSVWDLWQQLPEKGEYLIITSSRKDALCIWANTGIPACSLQAESYFPKKQVIEELKNRFTHVFVLYDNDYEKVDNPGRTLGAKIANEFGLTQIEIPSLYLSKDSSDLCKNHNPKLLIEVIYKLINKQISF